MMQVDRLGSFSTFFVETHPNKSDTHFHSCCLCEVLAVFYDSQFWAGPNTQKQDKLPVFGPSCTYTYIYIHTLYNNMRKIFNIDIVSISHAVSHVFLSCRASLVSKRCLPVAVRDTKEAQLSLPLGSAEG